MKRLIFLSFWYTVCFPDLARCVTLNELKFVYPEMRPYVYREQGQLNGFTPKLLQLVWQDLKLKELDITIMPWRLAYNKSWKLPGYVLMGLTRSEKNETRFKWACAIDQVKIVLVGMRKNENVLVLNSLLDYQRYRYALPLLSPAEDIMLKSKNLESKNFLRLSETHSVIKMLVAEQVDLAIGGLTFFVSYLAEMRLKPSAIRVYELLGKYPYCFAFHEKTPDILVAQFEHALQKVNKTAEAKTLREKFLPDLSEMIPSRK